MSPGGTIFQAWVDACEAGTDPAIVTSSGRCPARGARRARDHRTDQTGLRAHRVRLTEHRRLSSPPQRGAAVLSRTVSCGDRGHPIGEHLGGVDLFEQELRRIRPEPERVAGDAGDRRVHESGDDGIVDEAMERSDGTASPIS